MKRMMSLTIAAALIVPGIIVFAQERGGKPASDNREKPVQDWEKLTLPGPQHQKLDVLAGRWKQKMRSRGGPKQDWSESSGETRFHWILGKRFLIEEAKCEFQGASFEWTGLYGFDKGRKKYVAVWADNFGTNLDMAECDAEPSGRMFAFAGEQTDPQGGATSKFRWIITVVDADHSRVEMYETEPGGQEVKVIEIEQSRIR